MALLQEGQQRALEGLTIALVHAQVDLGTTQQHHMFEHAIVEHIQDVRGPDIEGIVAERELQVFLCTLVVGHARKAQAQRRVGGPVVRIAHDRGLQRGHDFRVAMPHLKRPRRREQGLRVARVDLMRRSQRRRGALAVVGERGQREAQREHSTVVGHDLRGFLHQDLSRLEVFVVDRDLGAQGQRWHGGRVARQHRVGARSGLGDIVVAVEVDARHPDQGVLVGRVDLQDTAKRDIRVAEVVFRQKELAPSALNLLAFSPVTRAFGRVSQDFVGVLEVAIGRQGPRDGDELADISAGLVEVRKWIQHLARRHVLPDAVQRLAQGCSQLDVVLMLGERVGQDLERDGAVARAQLALALGQSAGDRRGTAAPSLARVGHATEPPQRFAEQRGLDVGSVFDRFEQADHAGVGTFKPGLLSRAAACRALDFLFAGGGGQDRWCDANRRGKHQRERAGRRDASHGTGEVPRSPPGGG